jgi:histidine kinase
MTATMTSALQDQLEVAFAQILAVAVPVSVAVALSAAYLASRRLLAPIDDVRSVVGRLARGVYSERVDPPVEEELAALAADINHLAEALEDTEHRRMRLLNDVSHELRTPLTTIEGYMEAILDGVIDPTPEIHATVLTESRRLKRLANDVNVLSRAEEGTLQLDRQPVEVDDLVDGILTRLAPQFEDAQVSAVIEPSPPAVVVGDHDRLVQVFTNLIGNAISYTPAGGAVSVSWSSPDDMVHIRVADTGRGIRREDIGRIFDRFIRVAPSSAGGTGVGLTIARSIARLHGGDIAVRSNGIGHGSVFTVTLPATEGQPPRAGSSPNPN